MRSNVVLTRFTGGNTWQAMAASRAILSGVFAVSTGTWFMREVGKAGIQLPNGAIPFERLDLSQIEVYATSGFLFLFAGSW